MTDKRKHQLERIVRINYRHFNRMIYPKYFGIELLEQITRLMLDKIKLLQYTKTLNLTEARFMSQCVRTYYWYYILEINKFFSTSLHNFS